ncbi:MAG: phasin family protein [Acetobacteraceae bacterium]
MAVKARTNEATGEAGAASDAYEETVTSFKEGAGKAADRFEKTQDQVKDGMSKAMNTAEQVIAFNQGNFEAVVASGKVWSQGVQDLSKQVVASAQASLDETLAAFRALSGVKSLREAVDLQTSLARSMLEKSMSESGRITDASVRLAERAMAPLTERVTFAIEAFGRPTA